MVVLTFQERPAEGIEVDERDPLEALAEQRLVQRRPGRGAGQETFDRRRQLVEAPASVLGQARRGHGAKLLLPCQPALGPSGPGPRLTNIETEVTPAWP